MRALSWPVAGPLRGEGAWRPVKRGTGAGAARGPRSGSGRVMKLPRSAKCGSCSASSAEQTLLNGMSCAASAAVAWAQSRAAHRSEEHTSELQSHLNLVCRLLLEKKKKQTRNTE